MKARNKTAIMKRSMGIISERIMFTLYQEEEPKDWEIGENLGAREENEEEDAATVPASWAKKLSCHPGSVMGHLLMDLFLPQYVLNNGEKGLFEELDLKLPKTSRGNPYKGLPRAGSGCITVLFYLGFFISKFTSYSTLKVHRKGH